GFGSGAQHVEPGLSGGDLETVDKQQRAKGRRMTILVQADDDEYSAVWRSGSGTEWFAGGENSGDFFALNAGHHEKGFSLASLYTYDGRWRGVWRPGTGAQPIWDGMKEDELENFYNKKYGKEGLHLTVLRAKRYTKA